MRTPEVTFRSAVAADLPVIVTMLAADQLGATREVADLGPYEAAFAAIEGDPAHDVIVGVLGGEVVAALQLSILPCLTHGGRRRAQVEGVRVSAAHRGLGIGHRLLGEAIDRARRTDCVMVQLMTDKRRSEARRFYESLGFVATHEGMKLVLD